MLRSRRSSSHRPIQNDCQDGYDNQEIVSYLLEEAKRRLLCLVDLLPDRIGSDLTITGLPLGSDLTELGDMLSDLLLLRGVKLILELVHSCKPHEYCV